MEVVFLGTRMNTERNEVRALDVRVLDIQKIRLIRALFFLAFNHGFPYLLLVQIGHKAI